MLNYVFPAHGVVGARQLAGRDTAKETVVMNRSLLFFIALPLLLIAFPGCVGDDAGEEGSGTEALSPVDGFPIVPLGAELSDELGLPEFTDTFVSFEVEAAYDYLYDLEVGRILLSLWEGQVHRVIYQVPIRGDEVLREEKNQRILAGYAFDMSWDEGTETEDGILYLRSDGRVFALWNPEMDYLTVGTVAYRDAGG
jgi:hypothetical protein